jgi:transposase
VGKTKCGKGTKVMDVVDGHGTPIAVYVASASESEVNLIEPTLDQIQLRDCTPEHLLYDKAADSDPLRARLMQERGIELVCPHRKGRKKKSQQDGRALRRFKKRFKVERTHSWFHNYRRVVIRYETTPRRFLGWIYIACVLITLNRF